MQTAVKLFCSTLQKAPPCGGAFCFVCSYNRAMDHIYVYTALLGIVIGSFITALVSRYGVRSMLFGRSTCGTCGSKLGVLDLVPVFSYVLLRGRCRHCKSRISIMYVLVEIVTAGIFLVILNHILSLGIANGLAINLFILYSLSFVCLIALSVYDFIHFIIPDGLVSGFIIFGYIARLYELDITGQGIKLLDIYGGFMIAIPFLLLWIFSRGRWLGFGDVKLALGIGGILGLVSGISAVVLGVWVGALISLLIMIIARFGYSFGIRKKHLTIKSEVPFGPFLAIGVVLAFSLYPDIMGLSIFF